MYYIRQSLSNWTIKSPQKSLILFDYNWICICLIAIAISFNRFKYQIESPAGRLWRWASPVWWAWSGSKDLHWAPPGRSFWCCLLSYSTVSHYRGRTCDIQLPDQSGWSILYPWNSLPITNKIKIVWFRRHDFKVNRHPWNSVPLTKIKIIF